MTTTLTLTDQGVAYLTLNRPEVHNAFDDHLIDQLLDHLASAKQQQARLLVLGAKGQHFSAGADLNWMRRMAKASESDNLQDAHQLAQLMHQLDQLPCPTIARVQGAAYGGAVGLVACCDVAIAASSARFCLSEVKIGLVPAVISPFVSRTIGLRAMRHYALTAELINAETAQALGLITHRVATSDHDADDQTHLDQAVDDYVQKLLAASPQSLQQTKALLHHIEQTPLGPALLDHTCQVIAKARVSAQGQEGLNAFLDKRPPQWPAFKPSKAVP